MNYEIINFNKNSERKFATESVVKSSSAVNNRLEALSILSRLLSQQVEALQKNAKSENELIDEVNDGKIDLDREVQKYELELICCALLRTGERQRRAAKLLNVKISTLNAKIKRYGISLSGLEFAIR
jgi:DNA-binding NtrC family response regulator